MGILTSILTAPVTGPIRGVTWVAEQVLETARQSWYDVATIREELAELNRRFERGELDEAGFTDREELLLDRLEEARAWYEERAAGGGDR